jgi:hypothetical protein
VEDTVLNLTPASALLQSAAVTITADASLSVNAPEVSFNGAIITIG